MNTREQLADRQTAAINFILRTPKCALWADMGTGKTITTLTAITDLYDRADIRRVLIIAPLRVVLHTWAQETEKWAHTAYLTTTLIRGTPQQRAAQTQEDTDIHLINREMIPDLVKMLGNQWHYDCVVIDESSSFKNAGAQRFKALKKVLHKIDRLIELTGTPAANGYLDIWSQIYLLDGGQALGRTMTAYKQRYFRADYMGYNFTLRDGAKEKIEAAIADKVMRIEYPHSSEPRTNIIRVDLPENARKQYRELEKEYLLELAGEEVTALTAASLTGKLHQIAGGAVYTDTETKAWQHIHAAKLDALKEIREGTSDNLLVAYTYRHELERLKEAFPEAHTIDEKDIIEKWNNGKISMLLAHPASAGHGLNLQHGGHTIVWFGLNWSLELYQQFNARLHRQGQTRQVIIHHIVASNTVDEDITDALAKKDTTQRALLDAMRSRAIRNTQGN